MGLSEGDRITRLHETESGYVSVSVIGEEIGFKQKRFTKRCNGKRNRRSLDFAPNRNNEIKKGRHGGPAKSHVPRRMNRSVGRELCEVAQRKRGLSVPLLKDGIGVRWPNLGTWDLNGILRRRGHLRAPPRTTSFVFPLCQFWPFLFHSRPDRIYTYSALRCRISLVTSEFGNRSSLALYSNTRALFIRSYSNACDSSIQYRQRERERERDRNWSYWMQFLFRRIARLFTRCWERLNKP